MWEMRAWSSEELKIHVHVDLDWAKRPREEVIWWRDDDDQRNCGEAHWSRAQVTRALNSRVRVLRY